MTDDFQTETKNKIGFYIEVLILAALIILNVLDFFEKLTPEMDYVKKIISWTALGYLLYKASLSSIFFGEKHKTVDLILILGYFSMVVKNFIHYARQVIENSVTKDLFSETGKFLVDSSGELVQKHTIDGFEIPQYLFKLYQNIVNNESTILLFGLIIGYTVLVVLAFYIAIKVDIEAPSLLNALYLQGLPQTTGEMLKRFIMTFVVFMGFYVVVFNLMMEWLAIAVDAPLLMIGLVFYFFAGNLNMGEKLEKLGNMGEDFYQEFIEMFRQRDTMFWAVAGMLVLHIITDIPNLILPYVFGFADVLYEGTLQDTSIWNIAVEALQGLDLTSQIIMGAGYILNLVGILLLMIAPAYIWWHVYKKSEFDFNPLFFFIFVTTVVYFLLDPLFIIERVDVNTLLGVKISLQAITGSLLYLLMSLGAGLVVAFGSLLYLPKKLFVVLITLGVQVFFIRHMYFYFMSALNFYFNLLVGLLETNAYFKLITLGIIGVFTALFYISGSFTYIVKTWVD
jgi:hypothetical protein